MTDITATEHAVNLPDAPDTPEVVISIKGFDSNLRCRGFQFEVGKTYSVEGPVKVCDNGFHACPEDHHPFSVFDFYPPAGSRYCIVEQSGGMDAKCTKLASSNIRIIKEISLDELAQRAEKWVLDRADSVDGAVAIGDGEGAAASGYRGVATASGEQGAATASGDWGAATASGYRGVATASGYRGAATASGYRGAATVSGYRGAATASGNEGAATVSGYRGAATASGNEGAATVSGYRGAATASGYRGVATASGEQGAATAGGYHGIACALGRDGVARASVSGAVVLVNRLPTGDGGEIRHIVAAKVGDTIGDATIEPDTFYRLTDDGQVVKAEATP